MKVETALSLAAMAIAIDSNSKASKVVNSVEGLPGKDGLDGKNATQIYTFTDKPGGDKKKNPKGKEVIFSKLCEHTGEMVTFSEDETLTESDISGSVIIKDSGKIYRRNFTGAANVKWWGAKGDGVADDSDAIQAALENKKFRTIFFPRGQYKVSRPIRIPSFRHIEGEGSSYHDGTCIFPDLSVDWSAEYPDRGVLETKNFNWPNGFPSNSTAPDYWTQGSIKNLQVRCHLDAVYVTHPERIPDYGLVIWSPNEETLFERVMVQSARKASWYFGGYLSVPHVHDCSGWKSTEGYGLLMSRHPNSDYAAGLTEGGHNTSGGSIRLVGFSGDLNHSGLIGCDGSQSVLCVGLKSEYNNPAIHIFGSGTNHNRQRWVIEGYRHEAGPGRGDFVKVSGTASPMLEIGAGAAYNVDNLINNTVTGQVLPLSKYASVYTDPGHGKAIVPGSLDLSRKTTVGRFAGSNAAEFSVMQGETQRNLHVDVRNASVIYRFQVGGDVDELGNVTNRKSFVEIEGTQGQRMYLLGNSGTDSNRLLKLDADKLQLGLLATHKLGFFGATEVVRPAVTGADDSAKLTSLINALSTLGLIEV